MTTDKPINYGYNNSTSFSLIVSRETILAKKIQSGLVQEELIGLLAREKSSDAPIKSQTMSDLYFIFHQNY